MSEWGNTTLRSIRRSQRHRRKSLGKAQEEPRTGSYLVKALHWDALYNTCMCITWANSFSESNASSQCAEREVEKLRG